MIAVALTVWARSLSADKCNHLSENLPATLRVINTPYNFYVYNIPHRIPGGFMSLSALHNWKFELQAQAQAVPVHPVFPLLIFSSQSA